MITVPLNLSIGQHFYNRDGPDDIGIYRVREFDGRTRTHLYVDSVGTIEEAIERCRQLDSENIGDRVDS